MMRDGHVLCTCMAMFSQSNHPIVLKFHQHQYVTMLFNPNDQILDLIMAHDGHVLCTCMVMFLNLTI